MTPRGIFIRMHRFCLIVTVAIPMLHIHSRLHAQATCPYTLQHTDITCASYHDGTATVVMPPGASYTINWPGLGVQGPAVSWLHAGTYIVQIINMSIMGNVFVNGGFENGFQGFTSDYTVYDPLLGNPWQPGNCYPTDDIHNSFNQFTGTAQSGNFFLAVDGSPYGGNLFCQDVTVVPGTNYNISFGLLNMSYAPLAQIIVTINGVQVSPVFQPSYNAGVWQNCSFQWNSGSNTTVSVCMTDLEENPSGNDYGIDNFSFSPYQVICTATDSVTITAPLPLEMTDTIIRSIGCGESMSGEIEGVMSGGALPYTYQWTQNFSTTVFSTSNPLHGLSAGQYHLTVTDSLGCQMNYYFHVDSAVFSAGQASISDTLLCMGDTCTLSGNVDFQQASLMVNGHNFSSLPQTFTPASDTVFHIVITDTAGCFSERFIPVHTASLPIAEFTVADSVCAGTPVIFTQTAVEPGCQYTWTTGDGNILSSPSATYTYSLPGAYISGMMAENAAGCRDTFTRMVTVLPLPSAGFQLSSLQLYADHPDLTVINTSAAAYIQWILPDGTTATGDTLHYSFSGPGHFCITQQVQGAAGCMDSLTQCLDVLGESFVFIPNTITPDGDGLNDVFRIYGSGIRDVQMIIFNRWGAEVYASSSFTSWDACYQGHPVQQGIYAYRVLLADEYGKEFQFYGQLNIIR